MDPITQGLAGAAAAQAIARRPNLRAATIIGCLSAMSADLDIFIKSESDPLLILEMHRHFTHSIFFIPLGALLCAALFFASYRLVTHYREPLTRLPLGNAFAITLNWLFQKKDFSFREVYLWAIAGYATAGLVDLFTSYGTNYFWPLLDKRLALDNMPIIDPLFSGILLLLLVLAFSRKTKALTWAACLFFIAYTGFGFYQKHRATELLLTIATQRGDTPQRLRVMPAPLSLLLWRGIYETSEHYVCDGLWLGYLGGTRHYPGHRTTPVKTEQLTPPLPSDSTQARDIRRFNHFTQHWLYHPPGYTQNTLADFRYSPLPDSLQPLWGIKIDLEKPNTHITREYFSMRDSQQWNRFTTMLKGQPVEPLPLD